jgi:hypothetical protein
MNETLLNEERFIEQYKNLLDDQLRFHTIINKRIFQSVNICRGVITSKPLVIEALLRKQQLPAFEFLACKN